MHQVAAMVGKHGELGLRAGKLRVGSDMSQRRIGQPRILNGALAGADGLLPGR
jgi:hypothetical protein